MAEPQLTAAVLIYPGCIVAEVVEVAGRLARAGVTVIWASPDGESVIDESGIGLTPTTSLAQISKAKLDAIIVPGGDPGSVIGNDELRAIVTASADSGLVAGICAGALVLGDAGVITGRRITHNFRAPWSPPAIEDHVAHLLAGAETEPDRSVGVVVDGPIITALPNAAAEFSLAICRELGIYDNSQAQRLTRHLQGQYVPALFAEPGPAPTHDSPTVRTAAASDTDQLVNLQDQLFVADAGVHEPFVDLTWPQREGHNDFAQLLSSDTAIVLVAEVEDQAVGFLAGYITPASPTRQPVPYAVLRSLYVIGEHRNSGAGSAMIEHFVGWARDQSAVEAHVSAYSANPAAHRLYERHGFAARSLTRVLSL